MNREERCSLITEALPSFKFEGTAVSFERYGNGHINDTFKVTAKKGDILTDYIVQRVNTDIFTDPDMLMNNIKSVTDHVRSKVENKGGDPLREVMEIIKSLDDKLYFTDSAGGVWRAYRFVTDSVCLQSPRTSDDLKCAAAAFGRFAGELSDFDAKTLGETIPNFHNTVSRFADLSAAYEADKCGRAKSVTDEFLFAKEREEYASLLADSGIPLRVTHNDTKLNNILLDSATFKALCVIDLDTVMPGYSVTDFGDMIRFGTNTAAEDEKDLDKVDVDLALYEACVQGFVEGSVGRLTKEELLLLPDGARMMTFECGMRFLTDYLNGDVYFRTSYSEHNLVRCKNQFKLLSALEAKDSEIRAIINKYI